MSEGPYQSEDEVAASARASRKLTANVLETQVKKVAL